MVRTELREHIFKMLFQIEFNTLEEMPKHLELYAEPAVRQRGSVQL